MFLIILAVIFGLGAFAVIGYGFYSAASESKGNKEKGFLAEEADKQSQVLQMEAQLNSVRSELDTLRQKYQAMEKVMQLQKKIESELRVDLNTLRENNQNKPGLAELKEDTDLAKREIEKLDLAKTNLEAQLRASQDKMEKYKLQEQALIDKVEDFKNEVDSLKWQLQEKEDQLRVKDESLAKSSEKKVVSEEEYNKLKLKLEEAEKVLKIIHGAG